MFRNAMKYKVHALCVAIALVFTFVGYKLGYSDGTQDMKPKAVLLYDINEDGVRDAIVLNSKGRKLPYTCAGKGGGVVCERPVEKAMEIENALNRN